MADHTDKVPLTKEVLCGISLHLDYLGEGIRLGLIKASDQELEIVEALCNRIDGYEGSFESFSQATSYKQVLEKMIAALGKFYDELHNQFPEVK